MCSARGTSWRGLKTTALQNHLPNKQQILILECLELVLGGIPVHTEYRCLFFLRYEFLKYRNTGVI